MAGEALPISPGPWKIKEIGVFFSTVLDREEEIVAMVSSRNHGAKGNRELILGAEKLSNALYDFLSTWKPTDPSEQKLKAQLAAVWKEVRGVK